MTSWLQRQRKGDLQALADAAGIKETGGMLKEDLVGALDTKLRANASDYAGNPAFKEFYDRGGSPTKRQSVTADGEAKPRRRKTLKKEDLDSPDEDSPESKAIVARTPRAVQRVAERIPLPPSPAVVTDAIERQTAIVTSKVSAAWEKSGLTEMSEYVRELLSTVHGIETVVALLEAYALQRETLPWTTSMKIPPMKWIKKDEETVLYLPNLFEILTAKFWGTTMLWVFTSLLLPSLFGYFFNLTLTGRSHGPATRQSGKKPAHNIDPLTFNVVKALVSWLVYSQGIRFGGLIANDTVDRVNGAVFGGYQGIVIGSAIGAVASLYDAVLKK